MLIVGWGKRGKQVAYLGIEKCPNCRNWAHINMQELSSQVRLYFVPVAKFNKKHYAVCGVCDAAWEIDASDVPRLLRESVSIPSSEQAAVIWNRIDALMRQHSDDLAEFPEQGLNLLRKQLQREFSESWADYVFKRRLAAMVDTDRPS